MPRIVDYRADWRRRVRRSSGIQILTAIQPRVAHVINFIRSSTWVTPLRGFEQHVYSAEEKRAFAAEPGALLQWRKNAESNVNQIFPMLLGGSKLQSRTKRAVTRQMQDKLRDPKLQKRLIPTWDFGCRRMTPGEGYLEALQADNVHVVVGDIEKVTHAGAIAGGREHQLDVLICATGFDVSFCPRFPVLGLKGQNYRTPRLRRRTHTWA
jgi:cation diffusion facilitator CzcD-associated flavoprotein CzcO